MRARALIAASLFIMPLLASAQDNSKWIDRSNTLQAAEPIRGSFVERGGSVAFIPKGALGEPESELTPVGVSNPEAVSKAAATGVELEVELDFDAATGRAAVRDYRVAEPNVAKFILDAQSVADGTTPLEKFREVLNRELQPSESRSDAIPELRPGTPVEIARRQTEAELSQLYRAAVRDGDTNLRTAVVQQAAQVRRDLKAIYGAGIENYDPWTYEKIYARSRSVVAIADALDDRAICSGFLIASDLVMTAGHCFEAGSIDDMEVWFGFETTETDQATEPSRHSITELVFPSAPRHDEFFDRAAGQGFERSFIDLAVVRIGPADCASDPGCSPMPEDVEPACLREAPIRRSRPLYVIGYPRGNRAKVHDNARMYLPHAIQKRQLDAIRQEIEVDFADLEEDVRIALVEELTESYQADGSRFRLFDLEFGNQPKFGLIADTFKGNSGSPVFYRNDHCVAGILLGGSADTGERLMPSWVNHESALPMRAAIEMIEADSATAPLLGQLDLN